MDDLVVKKIWFAFQGLQNDDCMAPHSKIKVLVHHLANVIGSEEVWNKFQEKYDSANQLTGEHNNARFTFHTTSEPTTSTDNSDDTSRMIKTNSLEVGQLEQDDDGTRETNDAKTDPVVEDDKDGGNDAPCSNKVDSNIMIVSPIKCRSPTVDATVGGSGICTRSDTSYSSSFYNFDDLLCFLKDHLVLSSENHRSLNFEASTATTDASANCHGDLTQSSVEKIIKTDPDGLDSGSSVQATQSIQGSEKSIPVRKKESNKRSLSVEEKAANEKDKDWNLFNEVCYRVYNSKYQLHNKHWAFTFWCLFIEFSLKKDDLELSDLPADFIYSSMNKNKSEMDLLLNYTQRPAKMDVLELQYFMQNFLATCKFPNDFLLKNFIRSDELCVIEFPEALRQVEKYLTENHIPFELFQDEMECKYHHLTSRIIKQGELFVVRKNGKHHPGKKRHCRLYINRFTVDSGGEKDKGIEIFFPPMKLTLDEKQPCRMVIESPPNTVLVESQDRRTILDWYTLLQQAKNWSVENPQRNPYRFSFQQRCSQRYTTRKRIRQEREKKELDLEQERQERTKAEIELSHKTNILREMENAKAELERDIRQLNGIMNNTEKNQQTLLEELHVRGLELEHLTALKKELENSLEDERSAREDLEVVRRLQANLLETEMDEKENLRRLAQEKESLLENEQNKLLDLQNKLENGWKSMKMIESEKNSLQRRLELAERKLAEPIVLQQKIMRRIPITSHRGGGFIPAPQQLQVEAEETVSSLVYRTDLEKTGSIIESASCEPSAPNSLRITDLTPTDLPPESYNTTNDLVETESSTRDTECDIESKMEQALL